MINKRWPWPFSKVCWSFCSQAKALKILADRPCPGQGTLGPTRLCSHCQVSQFPQPGSHAGAKPSEEQDSDTGETLPQLSESWGGCFLGWIGVLMNKLFRTNSSKPKLRSEPGWPVSSLLPKSLVYPEHKDVTVLDKGSCRQKISLNWEHSELEWVLIQWPLSLYITS